MSSMKRWRGLTALIHDGVKYGSMAVERVQKDTAKIPFTILEAIPPIALPAKVAHVVHDASVSGVHGIVRVLNAVVGKTADVVLGALDRDP